MMRRLLSLFACLCMVLTFTVAAYADEDVSAGRISEQFGSIEQSGQDTIKVNNLEGAEIVLSKEYFEYTGSECRPSVTLKYKGAVVSSDCYSVRYSNCINVGGALVTVTGKDGVRGKVEKIYKITQATNPVTISLKKSVFRARDLKKSEAKTSVVFRNPHGAPTYISTSKYIKPSMDGTVKIVKGTPAGKYKMKVKVIAFNYKTKTATLTITVK